MPALNDFQKQRLVEKIRKIITHADQNARYECFHIVRVNDDEDDESCATYRWSMFAGRSCKYTFETTKELTFLEEQSEGSMEEMYMYLGLDMFDDKIKHKFGDSSVAGPGPGPDHDAEKRGLQIYLSTICEETSREHPIVEWESGHMVRLLEQDEQGEQIFRHQTPRGDIYLLYLRPRRTIDGDLFNWRWLIKDSTGNVVAYFFTDDRGNWEEFAPCTFSSSVTHVFNLFM